MTICSDIKNMWELSNMVILTVLLPMGSVIMMVSIIFDISGIVAYVGVVFAGVGIVALVYTLCFDPNMSRD